MYYYCGTSRLSDAMAEGDGEEIAKTNKPEQSGQVFPPPPFLRSSIDGWETFLVLHSDAQ